MTVASPGRKEGYGISWGEKFCYSYAACRRKKMVSLIRLKLFDTL
jgi:hypothetical protein